MQDITIAENLHTVGLIGAGRLAASLAAAMPPSLMLSWIVARSERGRNNIEGFVQEGASIIKSIDKIEVLPDIVILAVGDSAIAEVSAQLAAKFGDMLRERCVFHCSGIMDSSALQACRQAGARTASIHPYQTLFNPRKGIFSGVGWGIDPGNCDQAVLRWFVQQFGGKPVFLSQATLARLGLYHASAVAASAFITAAIGLSRELAEAAGISPQDFLPAIIGATIQNNIESLVQGAGMPLTGPFARADSEAIARHTASLEDYPDLKQGYINFAIATARLALGRGIISEHEFIQIDLLLRSKQ